MKVASIVVFASAAVALPVIPAGYHQGDSFSWLSDGHGNFACSSTYRSSSGRSHWYWISRNNIGKNSDDDCARFIGEITGANSESTPPTGGTQTSSYIPSPTQDSPSEPAASINIVPSSTSSSAPTSTSSSTSSSASSVAGTVGDDYPSKFKNSCGSIDQWSLNSCQCVSFVAWRISQHLDSSFDRSYKGGVWSDANQWDNAAQTAGFTVDNTPKPGSIAQTDAGTYGHVAWVAAVNGDQVQLEEYNALNSLAYDTRMVSASDFQYIHFPSS